MRKSIIRIMSSILILSITIVTLGECLNSEQPARDSSTAAQTSQESSAASSSATVNADAIQIRLVARLRRQILSPRAFTTLRNWSPNGAMGRLK